MSDTRHGVHDPRPDAARRWLQARSPPVELLGEPTGPCSQICLMRLTHRLQAANRRKPPCFVVRSRS
jgi:hypothetical protein